MEAQQVEGSQEGVGLQLLLRERSEAETVTWEEEPFPLSQRPKSPPRGHQTYWGKVREIRGGVFMSSHLCPCDSSPLSVPSTPGPIYCLPGPCHSPEHYSNVTYSMEASLTGRMSGSFFKLPGSPYLPSVTLRCPCLFLCLTPPCLGIP